MKTLLEMLRGGGSAFDKYFYEAPEELISVVTVGPDSGRCLMAFPVSAPIVAGERWIITHEQAWSSNHINTISRSEIRIGFDASDVRDGFAVARGEGGFNVNPNTNAVGLVQRRAIYDWLSPSSVTRFVKCYFSADSTGATGSQTCTIFAGKNSLKMLRLVPRGL